MTYSMQHPRRRHGHEAIAEQSCRGRPTQRLRYCAASLDSASVSLVVDKPEAWSIVDAKGRRRRGRRERPYVTSPPRCEDQLNWCRTTIRTTTRTAAVPVIALALTGTLTVTVTVS